MRIVAIAAVKNEVDVVEAFVRHTLVFVDRLITLDNGSTDGTLAILKDLAREGLALDVLSDPVIGKWQSRQLTSLMRERAVGHYGADWVLPLDADQFVAAPDDRLVTDDADSAHPLALPWHHYVPAEDDDPSQLNPVLCLRHRLAAGCDARIVIVPACLATLPNAVLPQGHHDLLIDGEAVPVRSGRAYLGHFPIRGPSQYLAKIAVSHLQYQTMLDRDPEWGSHYRAPFALLKRSSQAFVASFRSAAKTYLQPPGIAADLRTVPAPFPYRGGRLRYTKASDSLDHGWRTVLEYAERLAYLFAAGRTDRTADCGETEEDVAAHLASLRSEVDQQVRQRRRMEAEKEAVIQQQHRDLLRLSELCRLYHGELQQKERVIHSLHRSGSR